MNSYGHADVIMFDFTLGGEGEATSKDIWLEEGPNQYVSTIKVISLFILCSVEHQHAEPAETRVCSLRLELCLLFTGGSSLAINYRHLSLEAWGDPNTLASIEVRQTHRLASVSHGPQLYQT